MHAVGFGWIVLRSIGDVPTEVTAEELAQPFSDPLGPEAEEFFARNAWLRGKSADDVLDATFMVRPGIALEEISITDTESGMGFRPEVTRVTRTDGPRFSHEVDAAVRALLSGLHPQGLPLRDVVGLYAMSNGVVDGDALGELERESAAIVVDLIRHGLVLPSAIAEITTT